MINKLIDGLKDIKFICNIASSQGFKLVLDKIEDEEDKEILKVIRECIAKQCFYKEQPFLEEHSESDCENEEYDNNDNDNDYYNYRQWNSSDWGNYLGCDLEDLEIALENYADSLND